MDALVRDTLISLLRQLRAGYANPPRGFPQSVILCGVRDYRIRSAATKEIITSGRAFNVKAESRRLEDFRAEQIQPLYPQHSAETGKPVADEA